MQSITLRYVTGVFICRYPQPVMDEINGMAAQLSELVEYRNERKKREAKRIEFVQATSGKK